MSTSRRARYPGVKPFEYEEKDIFFGRIDDIAHLNEKIQEEDLIVLYSQSGLGKSSLIQAGLIPGLETQGKYHPLLVRFEAYKEHHPSLTSLTIEEESSPLQKTIESVQGSYEEAGANKLAVTEWIIDLLKDGDLWSQMKLAQLSKESDLPLLLIFDQFEELFSYPSHDILQFKAELAKLLYSTIPQSFRETLRAEFERRNIPYEEQFTLLNSLSVPIHAKVLFAIREDRLAKLDQISDYITITSHSWYGLKPLTISQAEEAIVCPAYLKQEDGFRSPQFDFSDEALDTILDFLTNKREDSIESFQLQILCDYCERLVKNQGVQVIQMDHVRDLEKVYQNYYNDKILDIKDRNDQEAARRFIEDGLILQQDRIFRRITMDQELILSKYRISQDLLDQLVDSRLIRRFPNTVKSFSYEIAHDTLLKPIRDAKEDRKGNSRPSSNLLEFTHSLGVEASINDKRVFRNLVNALEEGRCVAILGHHLFLAPSGRTLEAEFAEIMAQEGELLRFYIEDELFAFKNKRDLITNLWEFQRYLSEIKPNFQVRQLAEMPIQSWITFSPSDQLEQAFDDINRPFVSMFGDRTGKEDTSAEDVSRLLYLQGHQTDSDSLLLTNESIFPSMSRLLAGDSLPRSILQQIRRAEFILLLGVDFNRWYIQPMLWPILEGTDAVKLAIVQQDVSEIAVSRFSDTFNMLFTSMPIAKFVEQLNELVELGGLKWEQTYPTDTGSLSGVENLRRLLAEEKTEKVFKSLKELQLTNPEFELSLYSLSSNFFLLKDLERTGEIPPETSRIEQKKIIRSLFDLVTKFNAGIERAFLEERHSPTAEEDVLSKVTSLIGKAKLKESFLLLRNLNPSSDEIRKELVLLYSWYQEWDRRRRLKLSRLEEFRIGVSQISTALLELISSNRKEFQEIKQAGQDDGLYSELKSLIANDELSEVFELLRGTTFENEEDELILQSLISRYTKLQRDLNRGILASEEFSVRMNQMRANLLDFIDELAKNQK